MSANDEKKDSLSVLRSQKVDLWLGLKFLETSLCTCDERQKRLKYKLGNDIGRFLMIFKIREHCILIDEALAALPVKTPQLTCMLSAYILAS